jgi:hypothetical protein
VNVVVPPTTPELCFTVAPPAPILTGHVKGPEIGTDPSLKSPAPPAPAPLPPELFGCPPPPPPPTIIYSTVSLNDPGVVKSPLLVKV